MGRLTLVLPGLRLAEAEPQLAPDPPPKLGALLARADVQRGSLPLEARVFALFGHGAEICAFPPVAAASACRDLEPGAADLVRCDPIHVRADPTRLLLFDAAHFDLDADDADGLLARLAHELPALGLRRGPDPTRWYADAAAVGGWYGLSPRAMAGRPLSRDLPARGDAHAMHRLLTEVQMILHETPVNRARERRGLPAVNGVWPWGGGGLPAASTSLQCACGADVLIAGLAQAAGIDWTPAFDPARAIAAAKRGDVLAVSGAPFGAAAAGAAWLDADGEWPRALAGALWRGAIDGLVIVGEAEMFTLSRRALCRVWRKAPHFRWHRAS